MDGILYYGIINQLRENRSCGNSVPDSKLDCLPNVSMVKVNILSKYQAGKCCEQIITTQLQMKSYCT